MSVMVVFASALHGALALRTGLACSQRPWPVRSRPMPPVMALPGGWTPDRGLPAGISILNGFLGTAEDRQEAQEKLKVQVSADESLWQDNDFMKYVGAEEWRMVEYDRVVLLATFLQLKAGKLAAKWERSECDYYEEYIESFLGRSIWNRWVVHGYVDRTTRICRSSEGNNYGRWALISLEPDATPERLKQLIVPDDGAMLQLTFER